MHTIPCQRIEEYGEGGDKGLTLTSGHLGYLTLMEDNTTEELHIIMHHLPFQVVAACCPVVMIYRLVAIYSHKILGGIGCQLTVKIGGCDDGLLVLTESAGCVLDYGEGDRHNLIETFLIEFEHFLVELVNFLEYRLSLIDGCLLYRCLQLLYLFLLSHTFLVDICLELLCLGTELVVVKLAYLFVC